MTWPEIFNTLTQTGCPMPINPDEELRSDLVIEDSFLAPWGLSTEELPMHVLWSGKVDRISIKLPEELEPVDIHNVYSNSNLRSSSEKLEITGDELVTEGYIGLVFQDNEKYEEPVKSHEIEIEFEDQGQLLTVLKKATHIIRPQIQVQSAPEKIKLTDKEAPDSIDIDMEYVGFGMAQVAVEAKAGGEFVSEGESILHDLLEAILETEVHKQDVDSLDEIPEEWVNESDIEVPQEEIEGIVSDMSSLAKSGEFSEEYSSEEMMEVANALEEAENMSESDSDVAAVIYRFIETAMLTSILNVVDRHPAENVSLEKPKTKIRTKARTTEVEVNIRLRDSLENEYEPETIVIDVEDNRQKEAGVFETEINTNWENYQVNPDEVFADE